MKEQLNIVFDKISQTIKRNSENYTIAEPINFSALLFDEKYCISSNVTTCPEHQNVFKVLKEIKNKPILYWFTIDEKKFDATTLRSKYIDFKNLKSPRNSASYKPFLDLNSKTLYVGKVKKDFHLRLVTHLGYSKNKDTAGMQLFHWYKPEELGNLTLHYLVFEEEMSDLITILEMEFARELKPIIGKY